MKLWKIAALLCVCVLGVSGCTQSSISQSAPADGGLGMFMDDDEDETLPRDQNILIEEETEEQSMYDWEQVKDETDGLFMDANRYPQGETMTFEADEDALTIKLNWIVKDGTTEEQAMQYAVEMVKLFNDIVAVQSEELTISSADSFGNLWDTFSLTVRVGTADGTWLVDKTYAAGEAIDLVAVEEEYGDGPEPEEYNGPVKDDTKK